jgi:hypothetical protein
MANLSHWRLAVVVEVLLYTFGDLSSFYSRMTNFTVVPLLYENVTELIPVFIH